jgi:hypothetical protein
MICARPYCENKEDRINGYCSEYCQDLHELQIEAETHLHDKQTLQAENERLREALTEITTTGCTDCMRAASLGVHPICGPRESAVCEAWIAHRALATCRAAADPEEKARVR